MAQTYNDDEDLVMFDPEEDETEEQIDEEAMLDEEAGLSEGNPFANRDLIREWYANDTDDVSLLTAIMQQRAAARAERRKTGRTTGNFLLDLLCMFLFSPTRFRVGWEKFTKFRDLGKDSFMSDDPEENMLYDRKRIAFWKGILSKSFLLPTAGDLLGLLLAGFGFKHGIAMLGRGSMLGKTWWLVLSIVAFVIAWNCFKSILRGVVSTMEKAYNTVIEAKSQADKTRKAAKEAARKKLEAEKAAKEKLRKKKKAEPIAPSRRGRNYRSGGT